MLSGVSLAGAWFNFGFFVVESFGCCVYMNIFVQGRSAVCLFLFVCFVLCLCLFFCIFFCIVFLVSFVYCSYYLMFLFVSVFIFLSSFVLFSEFHLFIVLIVNFC